MEMIKICFLSMLVLGVAWAVPEFVSYPPEVDQLDVDAFINDPERVNKFIECVVNEVCDEKAKVIKDVLLDAFNSHCSKCSESEKQKMRKVTKHIIEKEPESWTKIVQKYDPELKHAATFRKFLEEGS
uniref:Chemosensory protein 23 n=1 Tax=Agrilus planipennis TaxID=224129 RepID=A0A890UUR6_AGRPL|nr:chemosensory protein 23 [Agrilus planipennis]